MEWISVEKRFPMPWKDVLVYDSIDGECFVAYRDDENKWVIPGFCDGRFSITHWMKLPDLQEGDQNEHMD